MRRTRELADVEAFFADAGAHVAPGDAGNDAPATRASTTASPAGD